MNNTWFTSDQHFGHKNIIKLCGRPFSSVEEMDSFIISYWNDCISNKDTIYVLGDFAWKNPKPYIERLRGNKIFIIGGHDKKLKGDNLVEVKINDVWFVLCHYPLYSWNKEHYGSIHLHGHIHNNHIEPKRNRINVSVDVWGFAPVPFEQIMAIKG